MRLVLYIGLYKLKISKNSLPIYASMIAGDKIYTAGTPVSRDPAEKNELWVLSSKDGSNLQTIELDEHPAYDGLSSVAGKLYLTTEEGSIICFGK